MVKIFNSKELTKKYKKILDKFWTKSIFHTYWYNRRFFIYAADYKEEF